MRSIIIVALLSSLASASALPNNRLNETIIKEPEDQAGAQIGAVDCREGFVYYEGWCVWYTPPHIGYYYPNAVKQCESVGAYAPSIHSEEDIMFWTKAQLQDRGWYFWLDAHCPGAGQPYQWLDGTPTDYLGPNDELADCELLAAMIIYAGKLAREYLNFAAAALCVYDPLNPIIRTTPTPNPTTSKPESTCGQTPIQPDLSLMNPGTPSVPYAWPWQVILCSKDWFNAKVCNFECGGSIVAPGWIVTAAHCVYEDLNPKNYKVKAGVFDEATSDQDAEQSVAVKSIHLYTEYDTRNMKYDIALVQLATSLTFGQHVQPVCLPKTDGTALDYPGDIWATGWGTQDKDSGSRKLHQTDVPLVDMSTCDKQYPGKVDVRIEFCAAKVGVNTCEGDVGGPMVSQTASGKWFQYGIIAWGCSEKSSSGVYTRVSTFCDWIEQTTRAAVQCKDVL